MGRPTKAVTALARASAATPPTGDPLEAPKVAALTERFLELKRQTLRDLVDRAVELGELLAEARPLLRGHYHRWLDERLGVDSSTAENYVALARLAREDPGLIQRFKELGPAKLYRVARLAPAARRKVLGRSGLDAMTDLEFAEVVGPYLEPGRKVTGNMKAHGLRMRVRGFAEKLGRTLPPAVDNGEMRAGLRRELLELARQIRAFADRL
ncbi:MAG: hypothetical protein AABZ30_10575 [Myxococcota bacterium]